eukprot:1338286-Amorphochlora_amoeboformis.AAC.1
MARACEKLKEGKAEQCFKTVCKSCQVEIMEKFKRMQETIDRLEKILSAQEKHSEKEMDVQLKKVDESIQMKGSFETELVRKDKRIEKQKRKVFELEERTRHMKTVLPKVKSLNSALGCFTVFTLCVFVAYIRCQFINTDDEPPPVLF